MKSTQSITLWIWVGVASIDIISYMWILGGFQPESKRSGTVSQALVSDESLIVLAAIFLFTVVPALISLSDFKWRNYIGYGIPMVAIVIATLHGFMCVGGAGTGYKCNFMDLIYGGAFLGFLTMYALISGLRLLIEKCISVKE